MKKYNEDRTGDVPAAQGKQIEPLSAYPGEQASEGAREGAGWGAAEGAREPVGAGEGRRARVRPATQKAPLPRPRAELPSESDSAQDTSLSALSVLSPP